MPLMTFMQVDIRYQMVLRSIYLLRDLELNFQGQTFQVAILSRLENANITSTIREKVT